MSKAVANAIDWYLNKMNTLHLVPANAATLIRDLSAKNIGGRGFIPRPLTIDNFTDAELDAIHRASFNAESGKYHDITEDSYDNVVKDKNGLGVFLYGNRRSPDGLLKYLSPLRMVSTTLGQAQVRKDKDSGDYVLRDTYDFNKDETGYRVEPDGSITDQAMNNYKNLEEFKAKHSKPAETTFYGSLRRNAGILGHNDEDPEEEKIHASISMKDIRERLGDKLGKTDIQSVPSRKKLILNSSVAGSLAGAPIGGALGALSGAILLLDKERRKNWFRTILSNVIGGAAIGAAVGGVGGGMASNYLHDRFQKKSEAKPERENKKNKMSKLITAMAYLAPLCLLGHSAAYSYGKARNLLDTMSRADSSTRASTRFVEDSPDTIYYQEPPI